MSMFQFLARAGTSRFDPGLSRPAPSY